jgi:rhodanese-related sulfurtransferase
LVIIQTIAEKFRLLQRSGLTLSSLNAIITMNTKEIRLISPQDFLKLKAEKADYFLIDLREKDELEISYIGGHHIPVGDIVMRLNEIPKDKKVILHCKSGKRAELALLLLQQHYEFDNLYSLEGGIMGVAELDNSIASY